MKYQTRLVKPVFAGPTPDPIFDEAAELLRAGELVAFPTETVYGLGADATSAAAVEAIFAAKERPADNPVIVHISHVDGVREVGDVSDPRVLLLGRTFWPGPLTLVIPAREPVRTAACRGLPTVAVRMPAHPVALAMLRATARPVAAPSANLSGRPSPTTAQHVLDDLMGSIPLVLDGGPCEVGIESTVLDLTGPEPRVLRPGVVTEDMLSRVLGCPVRRAEGAGLRRSPGTRYQHYRPSAPVILVGQLVSDDAIHELLTRLSDSVALVGYIAPLPLIPQTPYLVQLQVGMEPQSFARHLYAYFRQLDSLGVRAIVVREPQPWNPVMERLTRAASFVFRADLELESFYATGGLLTLHSTRPIPVQGEVA